MVVRRNNLSSAAALIALASLFFHAPALAQRQQVRPPVLADAIEQVMNATPMILARAADGRPISNGSGVLIDASQGYVITNEHVVRDRSLRYEVVFPDGRVERAQIVGAHRATDIALLRIAPQPSRKAVPFADTQRTRVTDSVYAIGYPRGIELTVTRGIISAKGRETGNPLAVESFLQTDAPISPGNSGGPLVNSAGEIVGINSLVRRDANSVGFAVPAEIVQSVINQLASAGVVTRATIGAEFALPSPRDAEAAGIAPAEGALVRRVRPDGQAARAGIEVGDVITRFDGRLVAGVSGLKAAVQLGRPLAPIRLEVRRAGQISQVNIIRDAAPSIPHAVDEGGSRIAVGGVLLRDPAPSDGLPTGSRALVVQAVETSSAAAAAGVEPGMIVFRIGDAEPASVAEARQMLQDVILPAAIAFIPGNVLDARFAKTWVIEE